MKAVIFDLDGTLVESAPDIHAAANALLRAMGYQPLSYETVKSFIGDGIPKLVERIMRASDIEYEQERHAGLTATFVELYSRNPSERSELFSGALEVLTHFSKEGIVLGVCTNKNHDIAVQILQALGVEAFFDVVIGGDSLLQRKPDPAPLRECIRQLGATQVVYVGDGEVDAATAQAAEVTFALFTEGYRQSAVEDLPHDFAFGDYRNLLKFADGVFTTEKAA